MPASQTQVNNFHVLDLAIKPKAALVNWNLRVFGLIDNELNIGWDAFQAMSQVHDTSDFTT